MRDFHIGDKVFVINFLYQYKDYDWLKVGAQGIIERELPTRNTKGMRRFLISFLINSNGEVETKKAKLYSEELGIDFCCLKGENDMCDNICYDFDNKIILNFFEISKKNIEKRYENDIKTLKNDDFLFKTIEKTKKTIAEQLQCSEDNISFSFIKDDLSINEIITEETKEKINSLLQKKEKEISRLSSICHNADVVVQYTSNYEDMANILADYNIFYDNNIINEKFGNTSIVDFDNGKEIN